MGSLSRHRVSVIVPTRDRDPLLQQALASVRANEDDGLELEVLVIDNGSGQSTQAIAAEFGARYLRCSIHGAAAARNRGFEAASGEFIAFLDDDDVWIPGHLRHQVDWLAQRPDFGGVLGQVRNIDHELRSAGPLWPQRLPDDGRLFTHLLRVMPQLGATVIRSSVLSEVGYFDERLGGDEDWDLHLRLALRRPVGFMPIPCALFRRRPNGTWDELHWRQIRSTRRVFWRNVRRAGNQAPSLGFVLRAWLHHLGASHTELLNNAGAHALAGRGPAARVALGRAFRVSPLHAAWSLVRRPDARWVAYTSLRPRLTRGGSGSEPVR